ncbi:MAG: hypothetical protein ACRDJV_05130 [Actinomycetota bacterium]
MAEFEDQGRAEGAVSRRELIGRGARGAVVGGTLLWAAPAISTLSGAAAQVRRTRCGCCYCFEGDPNNPFDDLCNDDGESGPRQDPAACAAFCASEGYSGSQQCAEFVGACTCRQITDPGVDPGENGCECN